MSRAIKYTETAEKELDDIFDYIANTLLEPKTAHDLVSLIIKEVLSLDEMPFRQRLYEDEPWHSKGLRVLTVKNHLVFFLPVESDNTVYIVRIMYGGRDINYLLNDLQ